MKKYSILDLELNQILYELSELEKPDDRKTIIYVRIIHYAKRAFLKLLADEYKHNNSVRMPKYVSGNSYTRTYVVYARRLWRDQKHRYL